MAKDRTKRPTPNSRRISPHGLTVSSTSPQGRNGTKSAEQDQWRRLGHVRFRGDRSARGHRFGLLGLLRLSQFAP